MSRIIIKAETFPERCEICHQTDCFDAKSEYCSRCSKISSSYFRTTGRKQRNFKSDVVYIFYCWLQRGVILGLCLGPLIATILWINEDYYEIKELILALLIFPCVFI